MKALTIKLFLWQVFINLSVRNQMNTFSIRDIENLSGIKAHTLRIWEQRYGIMAPQRRESNHRRYNSEDLKQILRISFLYHQGYKISKIAAMSSEEIKRLSLEFSSKSSYEVGGFH
jgi:MerR family transcriptional regulator, light-induced transcriptional regulator